jgi:general secretion pathway protein E
VEKRDAPATFSSCDETFVADKPSLGRHTNLESLLRAHSLLADEALARALLVERESGERLDLVITRLGLLPEDVLAKAMATETGLQLIEGRDLPALPLPGVGLSAQFLHDVRALPVRIEGDYVVVAVSNPFDDFVEQAFRFVFGLPVRRVMAKSTDIDAAIERLYRQVEVDESPDLDADGDDLDRLKDIVSDAPVIRAVNRLISRAVDERASDIHIEPTEDSLTVRFRIDGVLRPAAPLPAAMRAPFVSRIKIMAELNIAERRKPQDGRLRVAVRGNDIDLRVATAPSIHGESVVMRILDRSNLALDFATLGFSDQLAQKFSETIHRPYGIVLVTGPTGSGKTTTLYAALSALNAPERKLLTVEDPIEYRLAGIIQTQVNPAIDFTFGSALRSFLRQDPDVMMVGEIRDQETAQIAVQAALTGHMILSTLHTNTAAGAVTRLTDMGVEPFLLSSVLSGVLAQRLVRKLCDTCREPFTPDQALLDALGLAESRKLPETLYHARGCSKCSDSGYAGRAAVFEFLQVDNAIAALILQRADARSIAAAADRAGMQGLLLDGLEKAERGLTTIAEVMRVANGD